MIDWKRTPLAVALLLVLGTASAPLPATGRDLPTVGSPNDVEGGSLLLRPQGSPGYREVPVLATEVELLVTGLILRARVSQRFQNLSDVWVEGLYVFPLPETAAIDRLRLVVGERVIEGQIQERGEARRVYERARAEGAHASLVEQRRPNLFTTEVANLGPGEIVEVEIEYQEVLTYDSGELRLRCPTVVAPRYDPGEGAPIGPIGPMGEIVGGFAVARELPVNPIQIRVELDPGSPLGLLESPSHEIEITPLEENRFRVELAYGVEPANRDFELIWRPSVGRDPKAMAFTEEVEGDIYTLLLVLPPYEVDLDETALPRETVFVIDTSGSMQGDSIVQARLALLDALGRLREEDRFNLVAFNDSARKLFHDSRPAGAWAVDLAREWVHHLDADGGTEMLPALEAVLGEPEDPFFLRQVIFVTDGAVSNEEALFGYIEAELGDSRLFTVGIGSAPNTFFMRRAAEFGRGTFTYVGRSSEVEDRMAALFRKLEAPVLADLKVSATGPEVEIWPRRIPDLYVGVPLVVLARSAHSGGDLRALGERRGESWEQSFSLSDSRPGRGIAKLWARKKISALTAELHRGADPTEIRGRVLDLALAHDLLSPYTSLVAVDVTPVRPETASLEHRQVRVSPLHGGSGEILGTLPQGGSGAGLSLLLGIGLIAAGWAWRRLVGDSARGRA